MTPGKSIEKLEINTPSFEANLLKSYPITNCCKSNAINKTNTSIAIRDKHTGNKCEANRTTSIESWLPKGHKFHVPKHNYFLLIIGKILFQYH